MVLDILKDAKFFVALGLAVTSPYVLKQYVGRFVICKKDDLRPDLNKWDILWFWRWSAHNRDILLPGELVYSQRPRKAGLYSDSKHAENFCRFFLGEVSDVRTTVCICCRNQMAGKVLLRWPDDYDGLIDEHSSWVNAGMVKYRQPFRIWPLHRVGRVGTGGTTAANDDNGGNGGDDHSQQKQRHNNGAEDGEGTLNWQNRQQQQATT
ncbi:hypothetical protein niasHS_013999 [Heterodera schachtii]|uniref:Uncharacterized protein n=1 Tax=Heterodera schachtii TaxID=97005 RepID=A0ABD2IHU6_HETSC